MTGDKHSPVLDDRSLPLQKVIYYTYNTGHHTHKVDAEGYAEEPARSAAILDKIEKNPVFTFCERQIFSEQNITEVHSREMIQFLKNLENQDFFTPDVFPQKQSLLSKEHKLQHAGYYSFDPYVPLHKGIWDVALGSAFCSLTGAEWIRKQQASVFYSLGRPPGHHAGLSQMGGFCYLNNTAVAAQYLSHFGKVAVLDLDFHHGNGTQEIFWRRDDVLTVSLHGDPHTQYPYFWGYADEQGEGPGEGYNLNIPLTPGTNGLQYRTALAAVLKKIETFAPQYLVVALGVDTAAGDPSGCFHLRADDFFQNGLLISELGLPLLIVQEGGYLISRLGQHVLSFLLGVINNGDV